MSSYVFMLAATICNSNPASRRILKAWPHGPLPKACVLLLFIHLLLGSIRDGSYNISRCKLYFEIRNFTVHEYLSMS